MEFFLKINKVLKDLLRFLSGDIHTFQGYKAMKLRDVYKKPVMLYHQVYPP